MIRNNRIIFMTGLCVGTLLLSGCFSTNGVRGNTGKMSVYTIPDTEAEWIRNGEPIVFESDLWFPEDGADVLLDSEVYLLGKYKGVEFFVEKMDVRPYNRLYTKFGRNSYRIFEQRKNNDQSQRSY